MKSSARKGGKIELDAEEYLALIDDYDALGKRFRALGLKGFNASVTTTKPPSPERRWRSEKASEGQPFELRGFNINAVDWKTKDSSPAGPNEVWAWGFATDREGFILDDVVDLFNACEQYGEVKVGSYLVKLGGRDNNLLNRRRIKT